MHKYYHKITVTGRGSFPLDQLRRYEMFPITPDDVAKIQRSFENGSFGERFEITLGMYSSALGGDGDCIERFRSFGWSGYCVEIWKEVDGDDVLFWTNAGGYEGDRKYRDANPDMVS